ncbi:MAG: hypothetical protein GTN64_05600 [Candidatus Latescibacteria bacterium]|nr:hypothetical protein [Candidatus Latescibacterota bacterium]NIO78084.1 hypothetical protein [Candidatus Latescibacterota bacterium]
MQLTRKTIRHDLSDQVHGNTRRTAWVKGRRSMVDYIYRAFGEKKATELLDIRPRPGADAGEELMRRDLGADRAKTLEVFKLAFSDQNAGKVPTEEILAEYL